MSGSGLVAPAWWVASPPCQPTPRPTRVMVPVLSTATERLKTWTRCKVSPEFTDSLEAITSGGINCSFHRNRMLTGGKPRCSRRFSINAAAATGKGGSAGSISAVPSPMHPPCPRLGVPSHTLPRSRGRGCPLVPPHSSRSPCGPQLLDKGGGQQRAVLLGGLNKTSVCHRFGLFMAF